MAIDKDDMTLLDRALLHLDASAKRIGNGTYPREMTQIGLGEALARTRSHASLIMNDGIKRGFIVMSKEHVAGFHQKMLVASLTASGRGEAARLSRILNENGLSTDDVLVQPKRNGTEVGDIAEKLHRLQNQLEDLKARIDALSSETNPVGIERGVTV